VRYLTADEIKRINQEVIERYGGRREGAGEPLNPGSLDYLVEAVRARAAGRELYPGLYQKAAAYAVHIITRHIFEDGTKRTGMIATFLFLRLNGCELPGTTSASEVVEVSLAVEAHEMGVDEVAQWLERVAPTVPGVPPSGAGGAGTFGGCPP
jgi:death-on-curing protein